jgi:hypothetical protein
MMQARQQTHEWMLGKGRINSRHLHDFLASKVSSSTDAKPSEAKTKTGVSPAEDSML